MSLDQKRNEVGKLLACLLVSRKGACSIRELERDYRDTEGRPIPYRDFGFHSTIDFLRTIPNHVTLSSRNGDYTVHPVVSDKIKHVNELVIKQKSGKKHTPRSRRPVRSSRYYPQVCEPKPFIRNSVQKEIAHILVKNPSGVDTSSIIQCLENSNTIATPVDLSNVNDYINRVPHIAVANGSYVYPSRSLTATNETKQRKTPTIANGNTTNMSQVPEYSSRHNVAYPGGIEEDRDFYDDGDYYDDFADEDLVPEPLGRNNYAADNNYRPEESSRRSHDDDKTKLSSAEFIARARHQERQWQNHAFENRNTGENPNMELQRNDNGDNNIKSEPEYVSSSEDETVDIINSKLRSRLEQLIKKHPDGIWCANLLQTFLDEFKFPLDYVELGFASVCELAASLGKIFRIHRWNDRGDFMLYDASQPLPLAPKESETRSDSPLWEDEMTDNDDIEPFPMTMALHATEKLIPNDVMTQKESVGQERIPEISEDEDCIEVYVADVYTPSLFWIHLRKKRTKLRQLMKTMQDFYQQEGDRYTIPHVILEKGLNCVCMFDNSWHRAIIKTVKPDGDVTLIFYDFGTTKTYPPDSVRYLHRKFSNLPAQSIACGLYNVKPINSETWTRGASAEFWNKVDGLPLMAIVIKVDRENNSMLVSLVDTQNEDDFHMNDWMVEQKLAKYGSMETVTTDTTPYHEEPEIQERDTTTEVAEVPLVWPHTTMNNASESTLKPPPGFAKISEPSNIAAFMDPYTDGTSYNATEFGRSTYMNFCNVNLSNNPLAPQNATYNPLIFSTEAMIQILKNQFEMEWQKQMEDKFAAYKKLVMASFNPFTINGTTLNDSNTDPSTSHTNPFPQQSNPFHQEFATTTNNFEASNQFSTNLSSNNSNNPFGNANDTASLDVAELSNVNCTISNDSSINLEKLSSELRSLVTQESCKKADSNPIYENMNSFNPELDTHDTTNFFDNKSHSTATNTPNGQPEANGIPGKILFDEAQFVTNPKDRNNEEFFNQQFHCTNPFKVHATENFVNSVEPQKEQSFKIKVENFDGNNKPPIPPRNPNLINKSLNLKPRDPTTHVKSAELPTVPNDIPTTKVYYEAEAVMYDRRKIKETSKPTGTGRQSTGKLNREPSTSSCKKEMVSETSNSEITHTAQFIKQEFIDQEESFSQLDQNTKLTPSVEHHQSHNRLHSSGRTGGFKFTFKPVIDTEKPTAAQNDDGFEPDKRQNSPSHSPTLYSSQASLNEQKTEKTYQNPGVTSKSDVTMGTENFESLDANTRSMPANAFPPYHNHPLHQPQVQNTMPQYVPMYTPGPMQYRQNYPYYMSQPMQYPGTNQRMSIFGPGGYYSPAPNWPGTQLYNPGYAQQYPNAPNLHQYSQLWKQYNSQTSTRKTAQPTYRTETVQSQANLKSENDKSTGISSSSLSKTHHAQTKLPQENKENINTSQHHQMSSSLPEFTHYNTVPLTTPASTAPLSRNTPQGLTNAHSNDPSNLKERNLSTQLHEVSSQLPDQDTLRKETENSIEKKCSFAQACSNSETPPMVTKKNVEESFNKNLNTFPQSSPSKPTTRIFKPVETNNQTVYLFNIENQGWVCTDEITQTFTNYPSRNVVLRILEKLGVEIDFIEVNRTQSPMLFSQLDNTKLRLPRMTNTKKIKGSLHLTPLKSLARLMVVLQVVTDEEIQSLRIEKAPPPGSILPELVKLITAYKINDEYWVS